MHVHFISSRDTGETWIYYACSDNVSIMQGIDTNDVIKELFDSFLLHRVRLNRGGSYIKSPKWLENKKTVINLKNETDDECLRWSIICVLNYNEIMKKDFENIFEKIKHEDKEDKDFSLHKKDWKNFEQNYKSAALKIQLVCFSSKDSEEITLLYKLEYDLERENKVLLLKINDGDNEKFLLFCGKNQIRIILIWMVKK